MYQRGNAAPVKRAPKNVAVSVDFYTRHLPKGDRDVTIERLLGRVESEASSIFREMANGHMPEGDEREVAALFIALMMTRTPAMRRFDQSILDTSLDMITQMTAARQDVRERFMLWAENQEQEPHDPIQAAAYATLYKGEPGYKYPQGLSIDNMVLLAKDLTPILLDMNWLLMGAPDQKLFVTSDRPVFLHNPNPALTNVGPGLAQEHIEVTFPITQHLCLLATWKGPERFFDIPSALVEGVNRNITLGCDRQIFSPADIGYVGRLIGELGP